MVPFDPKSTLKLKSPLQAVWNMIVGFVFNLRNNIFIYKKFNHNNVYSKTVSTTYLKVPESYFSFLFLMQKSILYAKIGVSPKNFFSKFSFKYYIGLLFS